jgi:hypothetical protein
VKNNFPFEKIKELFACILEEKALSPVDKEDLLIDYDSELGGEFGRYLHLLEVQSKVLAHSKEKNDELAMQSALMRLRTHAMSLSSFFDAIVEDADVILRLDVWPEVPEGYEVPDCYSDPD